MTDKHTTETACWRIWYQMKERGPRLRKDNLMANCGIEDEQVFDEAIDALTRMGMVSEWWPDNGTPQYELIEDKPRMMQVFPTIWGESDD